MRAHELIKALLGHDNAAVYIDLGEDGEAEAMRVEYGPPGFTVFTDAHTTLTEVKENAKAEEAKRVVDSIAEALPQVIKDALDKVMTGELGKAFVEEIMERVAPCCTAEALAELAAES